MLTSSAREEEVVVVLPSPSVSVSSTVRLLADDVLVFVLPPSSPPKRLLSCESGISVMFNLLSFNFCCFITVELMVMNEY